MDRKQQNRKQRTADSVYNTKIKPYEANVTDYGKNESNGKYANITTSLKKNDGINAIVDWKKVKYSSKEVEEQFEFKTE